MWPYVQINNKNQMQGPVTEVERHLLFIGTAPTNTGKLLSLNTQSDFDKLLGRGRQRAENQPASRHGQRRSELDGCRLCAANRHGLERCRS